MESAPSVGDQNLKPEKKATLEDLYIFDKELTRARKLIKKGNTELAREIGTKTDDIHVWEDGTRFPTMDKIEAIARAYNLRLEELMEIFLRAKAARELEKTFKHKPISRFKRTEHSDVYGSPAGDSTRQRRSKIR